MGDLERRIYTIGHSTRSADQLIALLREPDVQLVADVRRWPVSARYPHFSAGELQATLAAADIGYCHLGVELGGYRDGGYPSYMETGEFTAGLTELERIAARRRVAVL